MGYTKFHDPWGSGSCCGTPDPGPDTPIVKAALNTWEQGIFDAHTLVTAAGTDEMQSSRVTGDTDPRYQQLASGKINWGSGSAPADTTLYRDSAGVLKTDGGFKATLFLSEQTPASAISFASKVIGDAAWRWEEHADGTQVWGDGTNPPDVILYRSAANVLRIEDQFSIYRVGQAADAELRLSRDAGFLANIRMRTGTLDRWGIQTDGSAESGANGGSNLMFQRYDDAGAFISNVLNMNRATGVVSITTPGAANGAVVSVDGTQGLTNKTYQGSGSPSTTGNISLKVTGDTQVRWVIDLAGTMSWSPGSGALDTTFGRTAAGQLGANSEFRSTRAAAGSLSFTTLVTGDTVPRWQVTAGGVASFGPGNAAVDIGWSRIGAGQLALSATGVAALLDIRTGAVSTTSLLRFSVGSVPRWEIGKNADVESGGGTQTGSNFEIRAISDNGAATNATILITRANGNVQLPGSLRINGNVGFYNTAPVAKPTVTGSRGGNAALASLLTALAGQGLLTDSSTA